MQRPYWIAAIAATAFMFTGCNDPDNPSFRGKLQAKQDVANSKLEYKAYGTPTEWAHHFYEILETDLNVNVEFMAGCMVSDDIPGYADAYNEIMASEIKRRHGADIFDRVQAIAIRKQKLEESTDDAIQPSRW